MKRHIDRNTIIVLMASSILAFLFYWYQWRPSQIKHDCSWVKVTEKAQPAYPAMSEAELRSQGIIKNCPTPLPLRVHSIGEYYDENFELKKSRIQTDTCINNNNKLIKEYSVAREAVSEKIGWRKATNEEYKFCLNDKGF